MKQPIHVILAGIVLALILPAAQAGSLDEQTIYGLRLGIPKDEALAIVRDKGFKPNGIVDLHDGSITYMHEKGRFTLYDTAGPPNSVWQALNVTMKGGKLVSIELAIRVKNSSEYHYPKNGELMRALVRRNGIPDLGPIDLDYHGHYKGYSACWGVCRTLKGFNRFWMQPTYFTLATGKGVGKGQSLRIEVEYSYSRQLEGDWTPTSTLMVLELHY